MKKLLVILIFLFLWQASTSAKDSTDRRYVGFDANPLLSQFLPFNRVALSDNTFAITTRRYWGNNGIRSAYGIGLGSSLDVEFLQFMFGYDHRRKLSSKWYYFTGLEMILRVSSEENTNGGLTTGDGQGFGVGGHWGVEYAFGKVVSISTEASLRLLVNVSDGDASFLLIPPINLTAHFNITKK